MARPHFDVLLLSGQSNAVGRAYNSADYEEFLPDVQYPKRSRYNPFEEAQNGVQPDTNLLEGSLRPAFVNRWINQTAGRIAIFKMAQGGTSLLADAQPGSGSVAWWETGNGDNLTDWACEQYNNYFLTLTGRQIDYTVRGMIWIQGENEAEFYDWDSNIDAQINKYRDALIKLRQDFVARLQPTPSTFPMYVPELGSHTNTYFANNGYRHIREAQSRAAAADANIKICSTLPPTFWTPPYKYMDSVHYGQEGQNLLGEDVADFIIQDANIELDPIETSGPLNPLPFLFGDELKDDDVLFVYGEEAI
jgi:hypothetical protein